MKNQALFSLKDKSKTLICRLLQFLIGALRVKSLATSRREAKIKLKELPPLNMYPFTLIIPLTTHFKNQKSR